MIYGVVLLAMLAAMLAVAIRQAWKVKTSADFLVAGRRLSVPILVATLLCSWIGAGSLFAGAELAFEEGLASLWLPAGGWAGLVVIYFLAGRARKFAQFTIPDLLETRYGTGARVMGTLCIIVSYTAIVSYQFKAGGEILQLAFGIGEERGMLIVAGFVIAFTAMAGMSSVAYVDLVVGTVVTIGCLVMFPALLDSAGGWSGVRTSLPASHFTLFGTMGAVEVLGYFLPVFMLLLGNQSMYQKFFSPARSVMPSFQLRDGSPGPCSSKPPSCYWPSWAGRSRGRASSRGCCPPGASFPTRRGTGSFPGSELFSWAPYSLRSSRRGTIISFPPPPMWCTMSTGGS